MNCPYLVEPGGGCLEPRCLDSTPSDMSNGMTTASASLPPESRMDTCQTLQYSAISKHSLIQDVRSFTEGLRTLSPQVSHASLSASPESKKEPTTKGICGRQRQPSLELLNPDSYCLKMCRESAPTCQWLSETCADLGMKFQDPSSLGLMTLGLRIEGNGSGLWATPSATDGTRAGMITERMTGQSLAQMVKTPERWPTPCGFSKDGKSNGPSGNELGFAVNRSLWPTPKGTPSGPDFARMSRKNSGGDDLATIVAREAFPTPTCDDADNSTLPVSLRDRDNLPGYLLRTGQESGGQLNPTWVEWLMGWPIGWTDLKPLATARYREWLQQHGGY